MSMHEPLSCAAAPQHTRFRPIAGVKLVDGQLLPAELMVCADCGLPARPRPAALAEA